MFDAITNVSSTKIRLANRIFARILVGPAPRNCCSSVLRVHAGVLRSVTVKMALWLLQSRY